MGDFLEKKWSTKHRIGLRACISFKERMINCAGVARQREKGVWARGGRLRESDEELYGGRYKVLKCFINFKHESKLLWDTIKLCSKYHFSRWFWQSQ